MAFGINETTVLAGSALQAQIVPTPFELYQPAALFGGNSYPGRCVILGKSADGKSLAAAYFIMGRSANSRNRVFEENGENLTIYPADASKVEDASLIIYSPVRRLGQQLIVTNGDQTDTIYDFLQVGRSFEDALQTRAFEPDAPNFTPRISGLLQLDGSERYKLSILKSMDADGTCCARYVFDYHAEAGLGHCIHTYAHDGNPLPSFSGEPERIAVPNSAKEFADSLWASLNEDNRISLFVCYYSIADGTRDSVVINRFQKV